MGGAIVPTIVPASGQNQPFRDNSSQFARSSKSLELLGIRRDIEDRGEELGRLANRRLQPLGHLTATCRFSRKQDLLTRHFLRIKATVFGPPQTQIPLRNYAINRGRRGDSFGDSAFKTRKNRPPFLARTLPAEKASSLALCPRVCPSHAASVPPRLAYPSGNRMWARGVMRRSPLGQSPGASRRGPLPVRNRPAPTP